MHQRRSKKILIYFLFLIIVSSINNLSLGGLKFKNVEDIKISGLNNIHKDNLIKEIKKISFKSIFFLNENEIDKIISQNTLVEEYEIFKKYPSSIYIKIQKTNFLAKINKNGKIYLVGSNGKLSNSHLSDEDLPFIFGDPNILQFLNLINLINESKI